MYLNVGELCVFFSLLLGAKIEINESPKQTTEERRRITNSINLFICIMLTTHTRKSQNYTPDGIDGGP